MTPQGKILLVDDHETNLAILEEILEDDYELRRASSGEEGLRVAGEFLPDLVLLDVMMPGDDGYATCRALRSRDDLRHVKIIMLSAKAMVSERLAGYEAGADDYVTKPFDADELASKVRVYMRLGSVEADNREVTHAKQELEAAKAELEATVAKLEAEVARRCEMEERLQHDALHDVLTDLPNRMLLVDRVNHCIRRAKRDPDHKFAVLFLDLDDFKVVNESLGHKIGDALLVEMARRLVTSLRSTDCTSRSTIGTTARLGGDEFVVLLDGMEGDRDGVFVAERLQEALSESMVLDGHEVRTKASFGIVPGSAEYEHADEILRDADTALHRAKEQGKSQVVTFDAAMRERAMARLRMEVELRKALESEGLHVHYQPIVSLASGDIEGFEALARWTHPELGNIPPFDFIPLAEQTGQILTLGQFVLRRACADLASWRLRFPERSSLSISVNFSGKQFGSPGIVERIEGALDQAGLARECLNVELTESVLLDSVGPGTEALHELSARSIGIHMDDFGTGYSSLAYLPRLPISALKLDRSFVRDITTNAADAAMIKAVVEMSHARGLKVVAEGVETVEQAALLRSLDCDLAQGNYFSKPVGAESVDGMLSGEAYRLASG